MGFRRRHSPTAPAVLTLAFDTQPLYTAVDGTLRSFSVLATRNGNAAAGVSVTIALNSEYTEVSAGTLTVETDGDGLAIFDDVVTDDLELACTFIASADGHEDVESDAFNSFSLETVTEGWTKLAVGTDLRAGADAQKIYSSITLAGKRVVLNAAEGTRGATSGSESSDPTLAPASGGPAAAFDGGDFCIWGTAALLNFLHLTGAGTIVCAGSSTDASNNDVLVDSNISTTANQGFDLIQNSSGTARFQLFISKTGTSIVNFGIGSADSSGAFAVGIFRLAGEGTGTAKGYINGATTPTATANIAAPAASGDATYPAWIGGRTQTLGFPLIGKFGFALFLENECTTAQLPAVYQMARAILTELGETPPA